MEVASRRGRAVLPAVVTDRVRPGGCFAPFHWNDLFGEYLSVNAVTSDAVDPVSFQPEFKVCAVSLAKVGHAGRGRPGAGPSAPAADAGRDLVAASPADRRRARPSSFGLDDRPAAGARPSTNATTSPASWPGSDSGARRAFPCCRRTRPSAPEHALWVNGVLAGMYSRAAGPQPAREPAAPAGTRRP